MYCTIYIYLAIYVYTCIYIYMQFTKQNDFIITRYFRNVWTLEKMKYKMKNAANKVKSNEI